MYPGEYPTPLPRVTNVNTPVVSGYATARLRAADFPFPQISGLEDYKARVIATNVGSTTVAFQLKQASDISATGTRTSVGPAISLVPGGRKGFDLVPWLPYLEVHGTATGNVLIQIDSQTKWEEMAFDKVDTFYPPQLYQQPPKAG